MRKETTTFWDHLDELRSSLIKIIVVTVTLGLVMFFFKETLFDVILAQKNDWFLTYRIFHKINTFLSFSDSSDMTFHVQLINTGLAEQFLIHMKVAIYAGLLCASPYVLYVLFRFVSPALYENEKRYAVKVVFGGYFMFIIGVLISYFVIFPLTFHFLGTYQVSSEVINMINLNSYIDTMMMNMMMGIVFEIPILCWMFAKLGFLTASFMKRYRRHTIVIIAIVAAIITPTADVFTLVLVAMPTYVLYEISIIIVQRTATNTNQEEVV